MVRPYILRQEPQRLGEKKMDDDLVAQFVGITEASAGKAQQYLRISDGNMEQAVELYFSTGGIDLEGPSSQTPAFASDPPAEPSQDTRPITQRPAPRNDASVVNLDSDEEVEVDDDDDDPVITGYRSRQPLGAPRSANRTPANATPLIPQLHQYEDEDAAMARRLQEEIYAGGDAGGGMAEGGYRAPIARTRETLVGPEPYDVADRDDLRAAVTEQMRARQFYRQRGECMSSPRRILLIDFRPWWTRHIQPAP